MVVAGSTLVVVDTVLVVHKVARKAARIDSVEGTHSNLAIEGLQVRHRSGCAAG